MFNRRILHSILVFFLLSALILPAFSFANTDRDLAVLVDGKKVHFPDEKPRIDANSRVLIPVRFVSEALGANVHFENQIVSIFKDDQRIELPIGSNVATVNGQDMTFDTSASIIGERTMVPLRFVSEALGETVEWDSVSRYVWIGEKDVPMMKDVSRTADFDEFREMYGDQEHLIRSFDRYEDIQVIPHDQLPVIADGRLSDKIIYNIWIDEYEHEPVIKIHYDGRHFDVYYLTEDNIPRGRTNIAAWRTENTDGSFVGTFLLRTSSDDYRRGADNWEQFQYTDIKYIGIKADTYSLPLYKANFN